VKKPNRKTLIGGGIAALVLAIAAIGVSQHGAHAQAPATASKAVLTVSTTLPQQKDWPVTLAASGSIVAWQEAIIGAETGGLRIAALYADVGQQVKKGQLLAELARATVEADLRRYEAALASAKATLAQAKANADRARLVKGSGAISDQQVAEYLATEQTAQASVEQAEAQVAAQKVTLAQTRIVAVDDGIITAKSGLLGQVVSSGTELFRLQRQGRLEWQAEVDARQLAQIRTGAKAEVTLPSGKVLQGTVRLVAPTLSTSTSRANVLVTLPAGATAGMFASGRIQAGRQTVLTVPEAAVVLRDGISYVFEITRGEKVIRHRVETGLRHDGLVAVTAGLQAGMQIAASGGAFLADGDNVRLAREAQ
jgi:RND family efflux transporter MFP subunit